jgi:hypothetical protein
MVSSDAGIGAILASVHSSGGHCSDASGQDHNSPWPLLYLATRSSTRPPYPCAVPVEPHDAGCLCLPCRRTPEADSFFAAPLPSQAPAPDPLLIPPAGGASSYLTFQQSIRCISIAPSSPCRCRERDGWDHSHGGRRTDQACRAHSDRQDDPSDHRRVSAHGGPPTRGRATVGPSP